MVVSKKMIKLSKNRIICFYVHESHSNKYSIEEYFLKGNIYKQYTLCKGHKDNYSFKGWVNASIPEKEQMQQVLYDFDITHPFYIPLLKLLDGKDHLIIEDDETLGINHKYVFINRDENKVYLSFINNLVNDDVTTKFQSTIKNSTSKDISKIDYYGDNTRERLNNFYEELIDRIYQIPIEEYLLKTKGREDEEVKKYIKSIKPIHNN